MSEPSGEALTVPENENQGADVRIVRIVHIIWKNPCLCRNYSLFFEPVKMIIRNSRIANWVNRL